MRIAYTINLAALGILFEEIATTIYSHENNDTHRLAFATARTKYQKQNDRISNFP